MCTPDFGAISGVIFWSKNGVMQYTAGSVPVLLLLVLVLVLASTGR
jgi:hypothetical protein